VGGDVPAQRPILGREKRRILMLMKKWLVFYTKSRHEKKVKEILLKRGFEVFLPMQKVMRQWTDRKKKVEVPLFNSYIFAFEAEDKIPQILQTPGISWNIRYNDKPAFLREEELAIIKRFLSSGLFIETGYDQQLGDGDAVEVIDGPLKGLSGSIIRSSSGDKFFVLLESIQQNITVAVDSIVLKLLK
jgi:transcription termination/antitermination protein NusG